jgi:hypothetical protein
MRAIWVETTLPDGDYEGTWEGYLVDLDHDGRRYQITVDGGVGPPTPCTVVVRGLTVTVEADDPDPDPRHNPPSQSELNELLETPVDDEEEEDQWSHHPQPQKPQNPSRKPPGTTK